MNSGTLNGRYELGTMLGYGGMSEVREARDTLLHRDVAIKILRADLARDQNFLERFRREARNSASLNHPNIVAIYDTGETHTVDGTVAYIVMEKLNGVTLREVIHREGPLGIDRSLRLIARVANALDYSHQMGIVHRDIKPANIMLNSSDSPKVMDFGISRAADDMQQLTQTSTVFGTAQYISPEHAMGHSIDYRADIYALGCVLYECLTGQPPFIADTAVAVACKHVQDAAEPPSSMNKEISAELDAVVLKALDKNPQQRYQTAGDFQEALEEILGDKVAPRVTVPSYQAMGGTLAHNSDPTEAIAGVKSAVLPLEEKPDNPTSIFTTTALAAQSPSSTGELPALEASGLAQAGRRRFKVRQSSAAAASQDGQAPQAGKDARPAKKRMSPAVAVLISLLSVLVLTLGAGLVYYAVSGGGLSFGFGMKETLEDYQGREATPVYNELKKRGYEVDVAVDYIRAQPNGTVVRTNPPAQSRIAKNTTITLYVATGDQPITIPDVSGMEPDEARVHLKLTGIPVDSDEHSKPSDPSDRGRVVGTDPAAGKKAQPNASVQLLVGNGKRPVVIPDVVGMRADEAERALTHKKLKVHQVVVKSSKPQGTVVRLRGSTEDLVEGDTVTLEVSDGSLIVMPDLVGLSAGEVESQLSQEGWKGNLNVQKTGTLILSKLGRVAKQYPAAGAEVDNDAEVSVTVYELNLP